MTGNKHSMSFMPNADTFRIATLHALKLLDSPRSETFDRITTLCSEMFECRFAFLSLIDEKRQWFMSAVGSELKETPRQDAFCNLTIRQSACLIIEDAQQDARFSSNPLVTGPPFLRAYMGFPVFGPEGTALGALCVAHDAPRQFSLEDQRQLERLAHVIEDLIAAHVQTSTVTQLNDQMLSESLALRKSNQLLQQAERVGKIGSFEIDLQSGELVFSDHLYDLSGICAGDPLDTRRALALYDQSDHPRIKTALQNAAATGESFDYQSDLIVAGGAVKRVRCVGERLACEQNGKSRLVGVVQDITEAHHAHLAMKRAADYDSLTCLFNRSAFDRNLQDRIRAHKQCNQALWLVLFDLDGFKDINDYCGHLIGDVVLEEMSARLQKSVPPDAVLARWGGDEFALLPPLGSSQTDIEQIVESALATIQTIVAVADHKLQLSATCGIAQFEDGMGTKELLRRADLALYDGKKRGRSSFHFYQRSLEKDNVARVSALRQVRSAIEEARLFAAYQPIIDLDDESVVGMEALMRIDTRAGNKLTATQVLPALLDPVVAREITERMLHFVCTDFTRLREACPQLGTISLNVTENDLLSRNFAHRFLDTLRGACIDPRGITLEITETMLLVNDSDTVRRVLQTVAKEGVNIALDDFGTGFSSLSHLRDFPISQVKIDKTFIQSMNRDRQARTIVGALIAMANKMDIEVVAEGIETPEQLDMVSRMGCRLGQGYLFSPALDASNLCMAGFRNQRKRA